MVVSVLAFYSNDPSSIPTKVYNFSVKLLLKRTKINKKRPWLAHLKKSLFRGAVKLIAFKLCSVCACLKLRDIPKEQPQTCLVCQLGSFCSLSFSCSNEIQPFI